MPAASNRKKGMTIQSQAREVVRRVIEACDHENAEGKLQYSLTESTRRASFYTGFSERTICKIRKECNTETEEKKLPPAPEEQVNRPKTTTTCNNERVICDIQLVREALIEFYIVHKVIPTRSKLVAAISEKKKNVLWGANSFKKLLKDIGFKWKSSEKRRNVRRYVLERPEISLWRFEYLKAIKKAREENKNIIYVGDTWVDNKLNVRNCWNSGEWSVLQTSRFIILEAGNENGFVANVEYITKVGQTTDNCHLLNYDNFKKWLTEKLLPNIPQNSVIVLDGSESYHMEEQNRAPSKYATKCEMVEWLENNNISFSPQMCKVELTDLINKFKNTEKVYCVDELLKLEGHAVLRLPPYMCELNPLHCAWEKLRVVLGEMKKTEGSSLTLTSFIKLRAIIEKALASITATDWKGFCNQVQKGEVDYWVMDGTLDAQMEEMIADAENDETQGSVVDSGSEFSDLCSDEEWPPFEMVECGEEPTTGTEQQQADKQETILESILEKTKTKPMLYRPPFEMVECGEEPTTGTEQQTKTTTGRKSNATKRTSSEKKRKRKDNKTARTTNGDVTSQDGSNAKTQSTVDVLQLKKEMQEVLNKKARVGNENDVSEASVSSSSRSDQFAEVLIKEEVMLVDTAKNIFYDEEELPLVEIKQENDEDCNPLGISGLEEN